ncbi:MAG: YegS/Rv2252/BmrU family lipid kinase [Gloeocapsa sp. DLM2.Bin57]|nr:MAG: YegS/Rv2252/BmrU family lipid kinase [Gloeocapsa sp. DLM2.Bin57]
MSRKLALLSHLDQIDSLKAWIEKHKTILSGFDLVTTEQISKRINKQISCDTQLGIIKQILQQDISGVFFFCEPETLWLDYPNFHMLLQACQEYDIPLAINEASADLMIRGFSQSRFAYLIFNPVAGNGNPNQDLTLIRSFLEPQILVNVIYTQADLDPCEQVSAAIQGIKAQNQENHSLIIASGGDGTVSAVASALIGTDIPLGIIPRGTANAFAVALDIPTNLRGACDNIIAGNTHVIDAALCNDIPMILLAGLGFEAEMVNKANRELKNRFGSLAYILAGVQQLTEQQPFTATVEIDDEVQDLEITAITIANVAPPTSVLAQGFGEVIPDDGLLEVTIATSKTFLQGLNTVASLFTSALAGKPSNREDLIYVRTKSLTITTNTPQNLVIDGEIIETSSVHFRCLPQALTIIAPLSSLD